MNKEAPDYSIHSKRVLIGSELKEATLYLKDGIIADIAEGKINTNQAIEDLGDLVVMPGLIDSHVHINEPGRTEWEGFETITRAAIAGGITTLVDMPLNSSPVTIDVSSFKEKLKAAEGKLYCNCGFWGGIVPANASNLEEFADSGILGIKAFLTHSGIDEFPDVGMEDLRKGMKILSRKRLPLLAHAEIYWPHDGLDELEKKPESFSAFLNSRPKAWENKAIDLMIELCAEFESPVHIVHLSSAEALPAIKRARENGLPLTVETCPHYLYFSAEDIPDGNTLFKSAPPIRERANNEKLWKALREGLIDFIVTDHSPATPELKKIESGNLKEAWGGIAGIQFSLPVVWTAAKERGFTIPEIAALMSKNVARFIGLDNRKGELKTGFDADLVVWDPEQNFIVNKNDILYRHKITPYIGRQLSGSVKQTYVGGKKVFENGKILSLPQGKIILKNQGN